MEIWYTEKNYNINNVTGKPFQLRNVRDRSFWLKPPVTYLLLSINKMLSPKVPQSLLGYSSHSYKRHMRNNNTSNQDSIIKFQAFEFDCYIIFIHWSVMTPIWVIELHSKTDISLNI